MRLIDADEVQKILKHIRGKYVNRLPKANQLFWDTIRYIEKKVCSIPTVEAKEVVHGKWIGNTCSACCMNWDENMVNNADDWGYFEPMPNFCPHCGADMRKKVQHD